MPAVLPPYHWPLRISYWLSVLVVVKFLRAHSNIQRQTRNSTVINLQGENCNLPTMNLSPIAEVDRRKQRNTWPNRIYFQNAMAISLELITTIRGSFTNTKKQKDQLCESSVSIPFHFNMVSSAGPKSLLTVILIWLISICWFTLGESLHRYGKRTGEISIEINYSSNIVI